MSSEIKKATPVEVFAGPLWKSTMVKEMLIDNWILAFILNEFEGTMAPFRVQAGGVDPIKVVVSSDDYNVALRLIKEFNENDFEES